MVLNFNIYYGGKSFIGFLGVIILGYLLVFKGFEVVIITFIVSLRENRVLGVFRFLVLFF